MNPPSHIVLVYGNGIRTTSDEAAREKEFLKEQLRLPLLSFGLNPDSIGYCLAYDVVYVNPNGPINDIRNSIDQFVQAAIQVSGQYPQEFWYWWSNRPEAPAWFNNIEQQLGVAIGNGTSAFLQPDIFDHLNNIYKPALNSGSTVIAVTHSQGNLYVNQAYDLLFPSSTSPGKNNFHMVAVATPANRVADGSSYFTLLEDPIYLVPGSLDENTDNGPCVGGKCYKFFGLPYVWAFHDFTTSYLSGSVSGPAIVRRILSDISAVVGLSFNMSSKGLSATNGHVLSVVLPVGQMTAPVTINSLSGGDLSLDGVPLYSLAPQGSFSFSVATGTHTVSLSGDGTQVQGTINVVVYQPPTASFVLTSGTQSVTNGQALNLVVPFGGKATVTFSDQSHANIPGGTITEWLWGINSAQVFTVPSFSQQLAKGSYEVSLFVGDNTGTFGPGAVGTIMVMEGQAPTAGFTMSSGTHSGTDGETLTLTASSSNTADVSFDATGRSIAFNNSSIVNWTWTANNAIIGTTSKFSAIVPLGTTSISLVVTDNRGLQSAAATGTITVTQRQSGFLGAAPMNLPRANHQATVLADGRILVTGGDTIANTTSATATAEIFDPVTGLWHYTSPMHVARTAHRATRLLDGRVLITGGGNSSGSTATTEIFDPVSESFALVNVMSLPRHGHEAALLPDGRVIVIGGRCSVCGNYAVSSVEIYNPSTGVWQVAQSLPAGVTDHRVLVRNGNVLVFGGYDGFTANTYASVYSYNPATNVWSTLAPMTVPRDQHAIALLPDGRVFIVGGSLSTSSPWSSTEIYDPSAGSNGATVAGPSMAAARRLHQMVQFADGTFLVAGGTNECYGCPENVLNSAEYLNSLTGGWTSVGPMIIGRASAASVLLNDGRALLIGGITSASSITSTAEIYSK